MQALQNGEFDYIEGVSEVFEAEFFRHIKAKGILSKCAESYPNPRKKEEVPVSMYISSNTSMRLHGVNSFNAYPMVVRVGGMLIGLGPKGGKKVVHPDTKDVTLICEGFNKKNHYDRETPCDKDFLRKMAKDTDPDALMNWYGHDVVKVLRSKRAFDKEGIFIGDASYMFVPDNPRYEGSAKLLFDEGNHPISHEAYKKKTDEEKARCQWRRCYKMVTLLHTNRDMDFFMFVGVKVMSGKANECPVLYELVDQFVKAVGTGVMRRLILDRGFLDGKKISTCKRKYKIDVLIPLKRNMDIYKDAQALFQELEVEWDIFEPPKPKPKKLNRPRPKAVKKRERKRQETLKIRKAAKPPPPPEKILVKTEVASIEKFTSWSACTVPLTVVANREHYADGHEKIWYLMDTKKVWDPKRSRQEYHLRIAIEERYRHLKCFSGLCDFTSRAFSLVVNQVVFIMLAYSLLQLYLRRQGRKDLTKKTPTGIRKQLLPTTTHIVVYWQNHYGFFDQLEYTELMTVGLSDDARKKIGKKCRRLRRELDDDFKNPRPT